MTSPIILSVCIATYNRADMIGETIASILPQLSECTELLVFDGASPDRTCDVVESIVSGNPRVRYVRAETNGGVDHDFDRAIEMARGKYCWLFADDDVIVPDAIDRVLTEIDFSAPDLIVVDAEVRDVQLRRTLEASRLKFVGRREYRAADADALLADAGNALSFIGCTVVRRQWWMSRDRASYYGSLFVHVGVIFQQPPPAHAVVLGAPLVRIRLGNAMWSARSFEIWMLLWPKLIWGLPGYSDTARAAVTHREPWRKPARLLLERAQGGLGAEQYGLVGRKGSLSYQIFARILLMLPGPLVNAVAVLLLGVMGLGRGSGMYNVVAASPHATRFSRYLARSFGQSSSLGVRS